MPIASIISMNYALYLPHSIVFVDSILVLLTDNNKIGKVDILGI